DDLRINDCIYGLISTRNAARGTIGLSDYQLLVNNSPTGFLRPFDYEINSPNRAYDDPANKVFSEYFTKIGFWQTTNTLNDMGKILIGTCLVGIRWGDGETIGSTFGDGQERWFINRFQLAGVQLRVNDHFYLKSRININPLFEGDKITHQVIEMLDEFGGEPLVVNPLNSSLGRYTNHFGIYSDVSNERVFLVNSEICDLTLPRQISYNNRPIGVFCKGMTIRECYFIFNNNYQFPYGSGPREGDQTTAEILGKAIIVDAAGRTAANPCTLKVKNCFFRNCEEVINFQNGVTILQDFLCNELLNPKRVLHAIGTASFYGHSIGQNNWASGLIGGLPAKPAGNLLSWNVNYFGLASSVAKFAHNPNVSPFVSYLSLLNEITSIPIGDIDFPNNFQQPNLITRACPVSIPPFSNF
ncbi:hypothetical protein, partial [Umezakia ovalisporum]|uniref:hypothetical protein n=1 Tax=Umezakia ovalisporum TaxID=75695 RepID=UPI0039C719DC